MLDRPFLRGHRLGDGPSHARSACRPFPCFRVASITWVSGRILGHSHFPALTDIVFRTAT